MPFATADNRAYLASAIAYAKIPLWGTLDTLVTLGAIMLSGVRLWEESTNV